jgi:hypothetical protein
LTCPREKPADVLLEDRDCTIRITVEEAARCAVTIMFLMLPEWGTCGKTLIAEYIQGSAERA